jgi:hypothetical protein
VYTLKILGIRRNVLAVHHCDSYADLSELLETYRALDYKPEALVVEDRSDEQAA